MRIKKTIWLTSKSRMNSEVRLKRYDLYANILIIIYSFTLICVSISRSIDGESAGNNLNDFQQVILSVGVFTLSVIIYFADFRGKAASFRECYLRLDKLKDTETSETKLIQGYHEILHGYPNHDDIDYSKLIIGNPMDTGHKIKDANDSPITPTVIKTVQFLILSISVHVIFVALLVFPAYLLCQLMC